MKRELFQVSEQSCDIAVYDMLPGSNEKWSWQASGSEATQCSAGAAAAVMLVAAAAEIRTVPCGGRWTVAKAYAV